MFSSYINLAIRNLLKHKAFSFINIFGLSIGSICCLLISLYLYHQYTYDSSHENAVRIYQLGSESITSGEGEARATVPAAMVGALIQDSPEFGKSARMLRRFQDDKTLLSFEGSGSNRISFYETSSGHCYSNMVSNGQSCKEYKDGIIKLKI